MLSLIRTKTQEKDVGIEITRLCSMYMIVIVHILGSGGVLENLTRDSAIYKVLWILRIIVRPSPLIFTLITGYLMITKPFKFSRIFEIWKEVLFWDIFLCIIAWCINQYNRKEIILCDIVEQIFPVYKGEYWYVTSYIGLLFLTPFINSVAKSLQKKSYMLCCSVGYVIFSILPNILNSDAFGLDNGYGVIYLAYIYFVSGYFRYHGKEIQCWKIILLLFGVVVFTFILKSKNIIDLELNMNSPTLILVAICLFLLIKKVKIKNKNIKKILLYVSPSTFAVYLIHCNPIIMDNLIRGKFIFLSELRTIKAFILVLLIAVVVNIICLLCDVVFRRLLYDFFIKEKVISKFKLK